METLKGIGRILNRLAARKMVTAVTMPLRKWRSEAPRSSGDLIKMDFMRHWVCVFSCVALVLSVAPAFAERAYTPEVTVERCVSTHDVRADGSDRETTKFVLRIDTAQGVSESGAQRISYRSGIDEVESIEASTIKARRNGDQSPGKCHSDPGRGQRRRGDRVQRYEVQGDRVPGGRGRRSRSLQSRRSIIERRRSRSSSRTAHVLSPQWKWEYWEVKINVPTGLPLYVQQRGIAGGLSINQGRRESLPIHLPRT